MECECPGSDFYDELLKGKSILAQVSFECDKVYSLVDDLGKQTYSIKNDHSAHFDYCLIEATKIVKQLTDNIS